MSNPSPQEIRALADAGGVLVLRVVPGAKVERAAIANGGLKLWTRTAPEDGKATKAVLAQLAGLLGIPVREVELVSGATSRDKRVRIADAA
ncbi:MAG: DUF167 domain-containing protein [Sphingomonadales bacterium]|jgi:uncharacterized protein YggU (UPF0235/DUF167 family)|nr:DUF167 domain-containing protein [Sphingomonadales bacterium]MBK9002913.1 DUF167 domain-containing protein [Sphingomonadales bacterium]MBK9268161.1 DUF167 domain-containing protein [Sphingomonadales bacterium]MBP6434288.1 DUF167 domain-containing protein [Sphingorhabdus sp.]